LALYKGNGERGRVQVHFDTLTDFSAITGLGIQLLDDGGCVRFFTGEYEATCAALVFLNDLLDCKEASNSAIYRSTVRSAEFGGLYTFLDPRGLTFITAPIVRGGVIDRFIVAGPIILASLDDYLDYEVGSQAKSDFNRDAARQTLATIPVRDANIISKLAEQIFVNAAFLSSGSMLGLSAILAGECFGASGIGEAQDKRLKVRRYMYNDKKALSEQYQVLTNLENNDAVQAKVLFNEILDQILFHSRNNIDLIRARAFEFVMVLAQSASRSGADTKSTTQLRNRAFLEMEELESLDAIVSWLNNVISQFSFCIYTNPGSKHADTVRRCMAYMREHYGEKITLNDVAGHVSFSPTYLCSVFKNETGKSFKSCLNRIRIERSKELMADMTLSIADISYMVGFSDQSYFAKVFKQYESVSPYHYRLTCGLGNTA
jgi:AraC-like DNA-binding protein